MRLLEHPEYRVWCDYDRFVRTYEIPPPQGVFTTEAFNAGLAVLLRAQHKTNAHPLDQHIPNGSQTNRSLLGIDEPVIAVGSVRHISSRSCRANAQRTQSPVG